MITAPRSPIAIVLVVVAIVAFASFAVIGALVSHAPAGSLDVAAASQFYGQATSAAAAITRAGTFPFYAGLCVIALIFGFVRRAWLTRAIVSVVFLVIAWQISDVFKLLYHRERPPHPLVFAETSYSYASGHAVLAMTFWGIWAAYALQYVSRPSARALAVIAIALWVLAIGWSRLALGAHYVSDVAGGYLLGFGFVCVATLVERALRRE